MQTQTQQDTHLAILQKLCHPHKVHPCPKINGLGSDYHISTIYKQRKVYINLTPHGFRLDEQEFIWSNPDLKQQIQSWIKGRKHMLTALQKLGRR